MSYYFALGRGVSFFGRVIFRRRTESKMEKAEQMRCLIYGNETRQGIVRATGSHPFAVRVEFYPEEEQKKIFGRQLRILKSRAEGYYCENCRSVFACFEEKFIGFLISAANMQRDTDRK